MVLIHTDETAWLVFPSPPMNGETISYIHLHPEERQSNGRKRNDECISLQMINFDELRASQATEELKKPTDDSHPRG